LNPTVNNAETVPLSISIYFQRDKSYFPPDMPDGRRRRAAEIRTGGKIFRRSRLLPPPPTAQEATALGPL
jgi:hypothetical protein